MVFMKTVDHTNLILIFFLECLKFVWPVAGVDSG